MNRRRLMKRIVLTLIGGMVLAGTMGQGCLFPAPEPDPVTVELTNLTSNEVQPYLWADSAIIDDPKVIMSTPVIDIGLPLAPGTPDFPAERATATFACADAGTIVVDGDLLLVPDGSLASENILLLQEGRDFNCGDVLSFYYNVDPEGKFFTSVYLNGEYLAP
jgi:hypothetical protein